MPQWELSADVDFDKFTMPELPIFQMTKPSTFVAVKEKQRVNILSSMKEPLPKFFARVAGGDKRQIEEEYNELMKHRIFFKIASKEEKVAAGCILVEKKLTSDSDKTSSLKSDDHVSESIEDQVTKEADEKNFLYGKIIGQRHGSDFLKFDLNLSGEKEVTEQSSALILRIIRAIVQWNKKMPENSLLLFFPELLERQVAAIRIQSAFRTYLRKLELYRQW